MLHSPGPGSHLPAELTGGAGACTLPSAGSRGTHCRQNSIFPISGFLHLQEREMERECRSQVHCLLLCLVSPLSPLPALLWLLSISQTLKEGKEKSSNLQGRREHAVTQREGRRKGGEEGDAARASHEWRCGSCHPVPPCRGPPQPSPSYAFPISPLALGHELPIINFY